MKTKKKNDVTGNSNTDENLPGYPHYPAKDDILNNEKRIDADIEDVPASSSLRNTIKPRKKNSETEEKSTTNDFVKGTDADVTKSDLKNLVPKDRDLDMGDDEELLDELTLGPDLTGDDLDVPGAELDDDWEDIGSEDEENNLYSNGQGD
jgi:hypothetical protein